MQIELIINDEKVAWDVSPAANLLTVLRQKGFASVKRGCGEGDCGACTVLVDGHSMRACLLRVCQVAGRHLTTVEGLGSYQHPHPLQHAFVQAGAVQCGFCTPGMILSAKALLDHNPSPTRAEILEALDGNLCRCTGYNKIIDAVFLAARRMES